MLPALQYPLQEYGEGGAPQRESVKGNLPQAEVGRSYPSWDGSRVPDSTQLRRDQLGSFAVYLYGEAAQTPSRQTLPAIRAGEYEALPEKVLPCIGGWVREGELPVILPPWGEWVGLGLLHLTPR